MEISEVASILSLAQNVGYPMLVLLGLAEAAGIPLPGGTAVITAAALADQHRLELPLVILLAATAAIAGDNRGYLVGPDHSPASEPVSFRPASRSSSATDPKAVFLGRWILGLRTWASWLAGASRMPWRSFFAWNAAGAVSWATTLSIVAYYAGHSTAGTAVLFGAAGLIGVLAVPGALLARRDRQRSTHPRSHGLRA